MNDKEHRYQERRVLESQKLLGDKILLYEIKSIETDEYNDPDIIYNEVPRVTYMQWTDQPNPTNHKDKWLKESSEVPWQVYIPTLDENYNRIHVERYCKVEIVDKFMDIDYSPRQINTFIISSIKGSQLNSVFWDCNITPFRHKTDMNKSTEEYDKYKLPNKSADRTNIVKYDPDDYNY